MAREKVTLTVNRDQLEELRDLVGARSLSVAVDGAIAAHLARLRHLAAVDEWLIELEREHGPVPPDTLEWAARLVEAWAGGGPAASGGRADAAARQ
jgi:hypothetical protein